MLGWGDYPVLAEQTINIASAYKRDAEGDLTIVEKKVSLEGCDQEPQECW